MGFFQRLRASVSGGAPRPNPDDERLWQGVQLTSVVMSRAGSVVSPETILQLDAVSACLTALSGPISTLPLGVFEQEDDDEADESEEPHRVQVEDHPVARLFNRAPNARQTPQEFRADMVNQLAVYRNFLAEITQDRATGEITALDAIHWSRIVKVEKRGGKVFYTYNKLPPEVGQDTLSEDFAWHIRMAPLTTDGLCGKPITQTSSEVFGRALAVKEYGNDWFRNSGQSGGIIKHPGNFKSKEDEDSFLFSWRRSSTGLQRHKDRLLKFGLDYEALSVQNDQAQFIETDREAALAICRLWNMPPHRVGILDRATFSNIEQQGLDYVIYTLCPYLVAVEQAIWRDLILADDAEKQELCVEFNVASLLRGDIKARFQAYAAGRQWGWLSANDIRRLENQRSIGPEGDRYLEPVNMRAVSDPLPTPAANPFGAPQPPAPDPEDNGDDKQGDDKQEGEDNADDA